MRDALSISLQADLGSFDFEIEQQIPLRGVTAIFGPSGAGKSSLLRFIAGFEKPKSGQIKFDKDVWFSSRERVNQPAHLRGVGYMFQDARLFPHLSVSQNLDYADKRSGAMTETTITRNQVVDAFQVAPLLARRPQTLSGGERQRVALARTLLTRPRLLLLDEPLVALDLKSKQEIYPFIEKLAGLFEIPILIISHDIDEVSLLADRMLILDQGRVVDFGALSDVMGKGAMTLSSGTIEPSVVLEGIVDAHDENMLSTRLRFGDAFLHVPINQQIKHGDKMRVRIKARDVALSTGPTEAISIRNRLPGTIESLKRNENSPHIDVGVRLNAGLVYARLTRDAVSELGLSVGDEVVALVKAAALDKKFYQ